MLLSEICCRREWAALSCHYFSLTPSGSTPSLSVELQSDLHRNLCASSFLHLLSIPGSCKFHVLHRPSLNINCSYRLQWRPHHKSCPSSSILSSPNLSRITRGYVVHISHSEGRFPTDTSCCFRPSPTSAPSLVSSWVSLPASWASNLLSALAFTWQRTSSYPRSSISC